MIEKGEEKAGFQWRGRFAAFWSLAFGLDSVYCMRRVGSGEGKWRWRVLRHVVVDEFEIGIEIEACVIPGW